VIAALERAHPGVAARLLDEKARCGVFVNIFVAEEDVRFLEGLDTLVGDGQAVSIIPPSPAAEAQKALPQPAESGYSFFPGLRKLGRSGTGMEVRPFVKDT